MSAGDGSTYTPLVSGFRCSCAVDGRAAPICVIESSVAEWRAESRRYRPASRHESSVNRRFAKSLAGRREERRSDSPAMSSQCTGGDLNPYALRRRNLNPLRMPISPPVRGAGYGSITIDVMGPIPSASAGRVPDELPHLASLIARKLPALALKARPRTPCRPSNSCGPKDVQPRIRSSCPPPAGSPRLPKCRSTIGRPFSTCVSCVSCVSRASLISSLPVPVTPAVNVSGSSGVSAPARTAPRCLPALRPRRCSTRRTRRRLRPRRGAPRRARANARRSARWRPS